MRPTFSVIITTYERNDLLGMAVASILRQTSSDWELIVVDDASPTPAIVPDDPRIRLVRLPTNGGAANARNVGASMATGDHLCFCDDDDEYPDDRLETLRPHLDRAPIVVCWTRYIDGAPKPGRILEGNVADTILDSTTPSPGAITVRRVDFPPFDPAHEALEDIEWWHRATASLRVATVPYHGYLARRHGGPRHNNGVNIRIQCNLAYLEEHAAWFARHRAAKSFRLRRVGFMYRSIGDVRAARRALAMSWLAKPSRRATAHLLRTFRRKTSP